MQALQTNEVSLALRRLYSYEDNSLLKVLKSWELSLSHKQETFPERKRLAKDGEDVATERPDQASAPPRSLTQNYFSLSANFYPEISKFEILYKLKRRGERAGTCNYLPHIPSRANF